MRHLIAKAMSTSLAVATVGALLVLSSSPAHSAGAVCNADSHLSTILKRGKLLAGVRFDAPPQGSVDQSGNNVGFGPDIAREFAKHLGVTVEFVQTNDGTRFALLQNGTIDAEFGITTPTKARNEVVDFADAPYMWDRAVIMIHEGKSKKPQDYYSDSTTVVCTTQGGLYADMWHKLAPKANMKLFQEFTDVVTALRTGKIDVAVIPEIAANQAMANLGDQSKGLVVGDSFYQDSESIMVPQNDSKWRNYINWGMQRMWADGTFQQLYKKDLGSDAPHELWHGGQLQPGVTDIGKECDPW